MPPALAVVVRGSTVVVIMGALLWVSRFFNADELRALDGFRHRKKSGRPVPPVETTELAGEIVAVDMEDANRQLGRNS
jgi:hypothetical protein